MKSEKSDKVVTLRVTFRLAGCASLTAVVRVPESTRERYLRTKESFVESRKELKRIGTMRTFVERNGDLLERLGFPTKQASLASLNVEMTVLETGLPEVKAELSRLEEELWAAVKEVLPFGNIDKLMQHDPFHFEWSARA